MVTSGVRGPIHISPGRINFQGTNYYTNWVILRGLFEGGSLRPSTARLLLYRWGEWQFYQRKPDKDIYLHNLLQ